MPSPRPLPPITYLEECFEMDKTSPTYLKWKERPPSHFSSRRGYLISLKRDPGSVAGGRSRGGDGSPRCMVKIDQLAYPVHRIVYALHNRKDPFPQEIDHIDRNPLNNDPCNLRVASRSQNASNRGTQANNTSGIRGVTFCKRTRRWMAQIRKDGKNIFLGRYLNLEEAKKAREKKEIDLHLDFSPLATQ
jgi:hypothetical protein